MSRHAGCSSVLAIVLLSAACADTPPASPNSSNGVARPKSPAQGVEIKHAIDEPRPSAGPQDVPPRVTSHEWPGFLGPHRNGKSDERGLPASWPAGGPPIVWQKPIGTGYSAPAIARGRLYHFARFGDADRLICFEAQSGAELWQCEHPTEYEDMLGYNNGPRATPVVDGERVYTYSAEGLLQCVRQADGQPVWRVDTM